MSEEKHGHGAGRPAAGGHAGPKLPEIDVCEHGAVIGGEPQSMDRRLFMQLLAYHVPPEGSVAASVEALSLALAASGLDSVIYADVNAPRGLALVSMSEDPGDFVRKLRPHFDQGLPAQLIPRPELTMFGRSYSGGYERDLAQWIIERPADTATKAEWPWAVWYPLRRTGAFEKLTKKEQAGILREHATIGRAYGEKDLAHDIRLACHGLDENDNEFVIGLVGAELHPLSHVVQTMRGTRQTSEYIQHMGPFFVGHRIWSSRD
ncbi:MAG: chlorite dismutase family protein [Deltaproteobacteria bacterium]|nr:chlorite dismutase family protein [Deltaproteobacteria bacterium]